VLLDAGDVSTQATGRNGGNIEAIPENFFGAYGTYDGFVQERYKFLKAAYPRCPTTRFAPRRSASRNHHQVRAREREAAPRRRDA